jgi:gliding motility-associated protein GldC
MNNESNTKSTIEVEVELDKDMMPVAIRWKSEANPQGADFAECKAFSLALFDKEYKDTFKIDLWTKEMQVVEMDRFVFQTLRSLGDTYFKATKNQDLANEMQMFVDHFGRRTGIITEEN